MINKRRNVLEMFIFTQVFHTAFIMFKKSLDTHLLLTNPTAVFVNDDWL